MESLGAAWKESNSRQGRHNPHGIIHGGSSAVMLSICSMRRAFTLIELLVVVSILTILAGLLFPVFARARESARQTSCTSNQRQIGLAVAMYTQDHDEAF